MHGAASRFSFVEDEYFWYKNYVGFYVRGVPPSTLRVLGGTEQLFLVHFLRGGLWAGCKLRATPVEKCVGSVLKDTKNQK